MNCFFFLVAQACADNLCFLFYRLISLTKWWKCEFEWNSFKQDITMREKFDSSTKCPSNKDVRPFMELPLFAEHLIYRNFRHLFMLVNPSIFSSFSISLRNIFRHLNVAKADPARERNNRPSRVIKRGKINVEMNNFQCGFLTSPKRKWNVFLIIGK